MHDVLDETGLLVERQHIEGRTDAHLGLLALPWRQGKGIAYRQECPRPASHPGRHQHEAASTSRRQLGCLLARDERRLVENGHRRYTLRMTTTLTGTLLLSGGPQGGRIDFDRHIERIDSLPASGPIILPGFIDSHVHGGGGGDTMDGPEGVTKLSRFHLGHGTTTLYPTTITKPWEQVMRALQGVREVQAAASPELPELPGANLEGPFISPERLGAQPPFAQEPTADKLTDVLSLNVVRLVTLAPEVPGALAAARSFARAGVRVSIGHTRANYEQACELLAVVQSEGGTAGFTHLYNAMGGLSGREPGTLGAALAHPEAFAELIYDTHHVHAGGLLAALAAKPERLHFITDAIRACGLPEGLTELGGQEVRVAGGAARLADGTLAGSVLTLDQALRNAREAGLPLALAARMLTETPARYLGLADRGRLEPGLRADLVVLNENLCVQEVYVAGRKLIG